MEAPGIDTKLHCQYNAGQPQPHVAKHERMVALLRGAIELRPCLIFYVAVASNIRMLIRIFRCQLNIKLIA